MMALLVGGSYLLYPSKPKNNVVAPCKLSHTATSPRIPRANLETNWQAQAEWLNFKEVYSETITGLAPDCFVGIEEL